MLGAMTNQFFYLCKDTRFQSSQPEIAGELLSDVQSSKRISIRNNEIGESFFSLFRKS